MKSLRKIGRVLFVPLPGERQAETVLWVVYRNVRVWLILGALYVVADWSLTVYFIYAEVTLHALS